MKLSPPIVIGSLSVCSTAVRLKGQLPGAGIEVFIDGRADPVCKGMASWGDEWFGLLAGETLPAGATVRARQSLGPDTSLLSTYGVQVQDRSSGMPQFEAPLMACSQLAVVNYLAPGATAHVTDSAGNALGSAVAAGSRAEVPLNRVVGGGETFNAWMDACGGAPSASVTSLPAQPMSDNRRIPPPTLAQPLFTCARVIHFANTKPGASLLLDRDDGVYTWGCSAIELNGRIDPPLKADELLTFWLEPPNPTCEADPSEKTTVRVPAGPPSQPQIETLPCIGTRLITISNLVDTAIVTVFADGQEVCVFGAGDETQDVDLALFPLAVGQQLTAIQKLCDVPSAASQPVGVTKAPENVFPKIPERPVTCGVVLRVQDVLAGSVVEVFSRILQGRIGFALANDADIDVLITPPFEFDDEIRVIVSGCKHTSLTEHVRPPVDLTPMDVEVPVERDRSVTVHGAVAGAILDVFVEGRWKGHTEAGARDVRVAVLDPLRTGQVVFVTERLCNQKRNSETVRVQATPEVVWSLLSRAGIAVANGHHHAGRVEAALALSSGRLLIGTEAGGAWVIGAGGPATSLSMDWTDARTRCLARGPRSDQHFYCGTPSGLMETDTSQLIPLLTWKVADGFGGFIMLGGPGRQINDILILPAHNLIMIATNNGVWWSPIPASSGSGYNWSSALNVSNGGFLSLALGPNESVIAYRGGPVVGAFLVGTWSGPSLSWTNTTPGISGPPADTRFNQVVPAMKNGVVTTCQSDRSHVYAALENTNNKGWLAVLHSADGGLTWEIPYTDAMLTFFLPPEVGGTIDMGYQAFRNLAIGVHPLNSQTVLLAGRRTGILGSTDGGKTWDANKWKAIADESFHADCMCLSFDPADPSGNTIVVGSDGGVFVSRDLGVSWDSSYNAQFPTLMFDQSALSSSPAMSSSAQFPGLTGGALQDNGNVYITAPGEDWQQIVGGDGQRTLFVGPSVMFYGGNDAKTMKWSGWDGANFSAPVPLIPPGYSAALDFKPYMAAVPVPQYHSPTTGALLCAVAGAPPDGTVYGLFDGGWNFDPIAERFYWQKLGSVPFRVNGIASLTGRTVIVGTISSHIYRLDAATGVVGEMTLPASLSTADVRWPVMATAKTAFALRGYTLLSTNDLQTWHEVATPSNASIEVLAVDRALDPPAIFAAGVTGAWYSRDWGITWIPTKGLPKRPQATHLEVVQTWAAGRWIQLGTWNWSVWRARLG